MNSDLIKVNLSRAEVNALIHNRKEKLTEHQLKLLHE